MRALPIRRVLSCLQWIAVPLLCLAFLLCMSGDGGGPQLPSVLAMQPPRTPKPTSKPSQPTSTPTLVPAAPTVPTPTPTRAPPTSTPTATYTPTPTPTPTNTPDVLATLVARPPEPTAVPEIAPASGSIELTLAQLGYGIVELNRSQPTQRYALDLPGRFEIAPQGSELLLAVHYYVTAPDESVSLEVELNGVSVHTTVLAQPDLTSRTLRIPVPEGLLQVGRNQLILYLRTEASCEVGGSIANVWIDDTSALDLQYSLGLYAPDLSRYPYPFVEESVLHIPTAIVLPDRPTSAELSAALTIAAGLGQASGGRIPLAILRARDFDPGVHGSYHLIVLGQGEDNALFAELALPPEAEAAVAGQGVDAVVLSPWDAGRLVLAVRAPDADGLSKAAAALLGEVQSLPVETAVATLSQAPVTASERAPAPWPGVTLASLGLSDLAFYGSKLQNLGVGLTLPLGWPLEEPGLLVLRFTHAEGLDPDQSVLTVRLNGELAGSVTLTEDNAFGGRVGISLPRGVLLPGRNRLEIAADLRLPGAPQAECASLDDKELWAMVDADSELNVTDSVAGSEKSLSRFPYPFSRTFEPNPTLFVLPDEPSQVVLDHALDLAVHLGAPVLTGHATCRVAYASEATSQLGRGQHVILLGTLSGNLFRQEFGTRLPRWLQPNGTVIIDGVSVTLSEERDLGVLQIDGSPWNTAYGLLTIAGTTDQGLGLALQGLLTQPGLLEGNLAVVEAGPLPDAGHSQEIVVRISSARPAVATPEATVVEDPDLQARLAEQWWK